MKASRSSLKGEVFMMSIICGISRRLARGSLSVEGAGLAGLGDEGSRTQVSPLRKLIKRGPEGGSARGTARPRGLPDWSSIS